jgi:hypothetical protein
MREWLTIQWPKEKEQSTIYNTWLWIVHWLSIRFSRKLLYLGDTLSDTGGKGRVCLIDTLIWKVTHCRDNWKKKKNTSPFRQYQTRYPRDKVTFAKTEWITNGQFRATCNIGNTTQNGLIWNKIHQTKQLIWTTHIS